MQDQDPTRPASGAEQSTSPETCTTLNPYEGWSLDLSKCSPELQMFGAAVILNAVGRPLQPGPNDDWMAAGQYLRYLTDSGDLKIASGFVIWEQWGMWSLGRWFWSDVGRRQNREIWNQFKQHRPLVEMTLGADLSADVTALDGVRSELEAKRVAMKDLIPAEMVDGEPRYIEVATAGGDPWISGIHGHTRSIKELIADGALTPKHAADKLSTHPALIPEENIEFAPVVAGELLDYVQAFAAMQRIVYGLNKHAGWWTDLDTGEPKERNDGELICLMHSELSEALEAHRKNLMDDKLPHRKGVEVELADTVIRILDYCGGRGLDLAGALIEKLALNAVREDHTPEARRGTNGKRF